MKKATVIGICLALAMVGLGLLAETSSAEEVTVQLIATQVRDGTSAERSITFYPGCQNNQVVVEGLDDQSGVITATLAATGEAILNFQSQAFEMEVPEGFSSVTFNVGWGFTFMHDVSVALEGTWWDGEEFVVTTSTEGCEAGVTPTPTPTPEGRYVINPSELTHPIGIPHAIENAIQFDVIRPITSTELGVTVTVSINGASREFSFNTDGPVTSKRIPLWEDCEVAELEWEWGDTVYKCYLPVVVKPEVTPTSTSTPTPTPIPFPMPPSPGHEDVTTLLEIEVYRNQEQVENLWDRDRSTFWNGGTPWTQIHLEVPGGLSLTRDEAQVAWIEVAPTSDRRYQLWMDGTLVGEWQPSDFNWVPGGVVTAVIDIPGEGHWKRMALAFPGTPTGEVKIMELFVFVVGN